MITIIGWLGDRIESLSGDQLGALAVSNTIFARPGLHNLLQALSPSATVVDFTSPFSTTIDAVGEHAGDCTIIASGDPNFFGLTKILRRTLPDHPLHILPGPSSVATLAARMGRPWDDLSIVSLVGRDHQESLQQASILLANQPNAAVALLVPAGTTLEPLIEKLIDWDKTVSITIATDLATDTETIINLTPPAALHWCSPSPAVVLIEVGNGSMEAVIEFQTGGASIFREDQLLTDGTNYTKLEVRMAAIARLNPDRLPIGAHVVEVGAGSGTLGLTLLRLRSDIKLTQLEPKHERAAMARANAKALGYRTTVTEQPVETISGNFDAAILGGGGLGALRHVLGLVASAAPVVATYADLRRGATAERLLGNISLIQVAHGKTLGSDGIRLVPQTPIYLAWR
ncbi:precorrin-6y C5,15-methyltransferase (decarboxylating) subunit CbiE [Ferrimicrobium sp.]|uniref:precorrin-6y C5,15-methyltransferase (decarboxylating) subunit CbiE n=1 Tax=Ferrimicrobium sp. TaxID=2926050 RepID=UPI002638574F|nr:precorrin-6y C5,15-methyltransferase (decarboxylating) subunit CbiE [Ferrimicrobium sp.]